MADTSVVNLNADLVGLRWGYFDVLEGEVLASFPGDGGLAAMSCLSSLLLALARTLQVIV